VLGSAQVAGLADGHAEDLTRVQQLLPMVQSLGACSSVHLLGLASTRHNEGLFRTRHSKCSHLPHEAQPG
jgi:hypothetical protein